MKIAIVGLLVGTLGVIPSAFAADWKLIDDGEEFAFYLDADSIKKNESMRTAWTLRSYKSKQRAPKGQQYQSIKIFGEYNCKNDKKRNTYSIVFPGQMADGSAIDADEVPSNWLPIVPDSIGESAFKTVCNR